MEQTETTMPAQPAATTATSKKPMPKAVIIAGAVIGLVAIFGLGIAALLLLRPQASSGSLGFSASNPQQATDKINSAVLDIVKASAAGDKDALAGLLSTDYGQLESGDLNMDMSVTGETPSQAMTLAFDLSYTPTQMQGKLDVTVPISPAQPTAGVTIEMRGVDNTLYFNITKLPEEAVETLAFVGLKPNQWYSVPVSKLQELSQDYATAPLTANPDLQETVANLEQNPLFINPRSANGRTVAGAQLGCMLADINPQVGQSLTGTPTASTTTVPMEICTNGDTYPVFAGVNVSDDGVTMKYEAVVSPRTAALNVEAPQGAEDLSALISILQNYMQQTLEVSDSVPEFDPGM